MVERISLRISLLPPEIKRDRQEQEKRRKIELIMLLVVVFLVVFNIFLLVNNLLLRGNMNTLQIKRAAVELESAGLEEYAELYREINSSEQLLITAMGTVPPWSAFFRNVSQSMPVTAWFSDLTALYSDQAATLTIQGWSYDHGSLADLLERLEKNEQLKQVKCRVSTETTFQGAEAIQFQVDATLLPGPGFLAEEGGAE